MAGYSGTPLPKKLGVKLDTRLRLVDPPAGFDPGAPEADGPGDLILAFCRDRAQLLAGLAAWFAEVGPEGTVWIAWPKKASKVPTDLTEDVVRNAALALGKVDVKVCAIDEVWSGLKLVTRVADRGR
jgi:hypothetical protein